MSGFRKKFENTFAGADTEDVEGWANHLLGTLPEPETESIRKARKYSGEARAFLMLHTVRGTIERLLWTHEAEHAKSVSGEEISRTEGQKIRDLWKKVQTALDRVPESALRQMAAKQGISVEEARGNLTARYLQAYGGDILE